MQKATISNKQIGNMKTTKNIFLLLFTFATLTVNGQNHLIGVTGSVNWTNVTANNNFASDINYRTGFATGFSYDYIFKKNFIIGADILYNQRGFTNDIIFIDENGNPTGQKATTNFNYDYLTIPLKVGYNYGKTFYCFANTGLTPAILIDAQTITPKIEFLPSEQNDVTDRVNKFDIGGIVEVGGGYKFEDRFWLYLSFSYQRSFTTITSSDYFANLKIRHNGMAINIGLKYALTK